MKLLTEFPTNYSHFKSILRILQQIKLSENMHLLKQTKTSLCPVCNIVKENHLITCSKQCASKYRSKVNWDEIDLINLIEVKKLSKIQIARELGCSDAAVGKHYRKLKNSTN